MTTQKRPLAGIDPALPRIPCSTILVHYFSIQIVNSDKRHSWKLHEYLSENRGIIVAIEPARKWRTAWYVANRIPRTCHVGSETTRNSEFSLPLRPGLMVFVQQLRLAHRQSVYGATMTRPIPNIVYGYVSTVMDGSFSHASRTNNIFNFEYVVTMTRVRPLDATTLK
jgi:hypothetical protein